jgi:hypothetical protein
MPSIQVNVGQQDVEFVLNFEGEHGRWTAQTQVHESCFPLVVELGGRRYELYSDGTFSEQEMKNPPPPDAEEP